VDTFGTKQTKPIMLSLILLAPPIGVVVGYSITGICISSNASWRSSFVLQGVAMALSFICIQIIPDSFINIDQVNILKRREKNKRQNNINNSRDSAGSLIQGEMGGTKVVKSQQQTPEIESKKIEFKNIIKMEKRDIEERVASFTEKPESAKRRFVKLLGNGAFVCTTMALSVLFFIVSGI
jgi:dipeptide/tripeptide permease